MSIRYCTYMKCTVEKIHQNWVLTIKVHVYCKAFLKFNLVYVSMTIYENS